LSKTTNSGVFHLNLAIMPPYFLIELFLAARQNDFTEAARSSPQKAPVSFYQLVDTLAQASQCQWGAGSPG